MAYNNTGCKRSNKDKLVYLSHLSIDNVPNIIKNLFISIEIDMGLENKIQSDLELFLMEFIKISKNLKGDQIDQFYSACKRRYDSITVLSTQLMQRQDDESIYVCTIDNRRVQVTNWPKGKIVRTEESQLYKLNYNPKCYRHLFRAIYNGISFLTNQLSLDRINDDVYNLNIKRLLLIVSTISKIYEDLRGNRKYNVGQEKIGLARLTKTFSLNKDNEWYEIFNRVKDDFNAGYVGHKVDKYIRPLVKAKQRGKLIKNYNYDDYSFSFKSSNTKDSKGHTVPAMFASLIETQSNGDTCIPGYKPEVNDCIPNGYSEDFARSISIESAKLSRRVIHVFNNETQDRMNYLHRRLANILRYYKCDCTFDQQKGKRFAQDLTFRPNGRNIYSLDISKATDTLSLEFQTMVLSLFFDDDIVDEWVSVIKKPRIFKYSDNTSEEYMQTVGQPQGVKSSFPAFALVHHLIFLMVMYKHDLEDMNPDEFYRVLGDDSLFSIEDPDLSIRDSYISACAWINWDVNPDKGYTYQYGHSISAVAEFAKVRYNNGQEFTPIPIKLLTKATLDESMKPILYWWSSRHIQKLDIMKYFTLIGLDTKSELITALPYLWLIISDMGSEMANSFSYSEYSLQAVPESMIHWTYITYFLRKLKQTLIYFYIPDSLKDDLGEISDKWKNPFFNNKWEETLLPFAHNSENKYLKLIEENERIITSLDTIFGQLSSPILSSSIISIAGEDQNCIFDTIQDIENRLNPEFNEIYPPTEETTKLYMRSISILNKYNPRSDVKNSVSSWDVFSSLFESVLSNTQNNCLCTL